MKRKFNHETMTAAQTAVHARIDPELKKEIMRMATAERRPEANLVRILLEEAVAARNGK